MKMLNQIKRISVNFILLGFCLSILFGSLFIACNSSENGNADDSTKITQASDGQISKGQAVDKNTEYFFPKEVIYDNRKENLIKDVFYPIGWSSDGAFAYIVGYMGEGNGFNYFDIYIQNLNTSTILFHWEYNDDGRAENAKIIWQKNYNTFRNELIKYQIVQTQDYKIENTTFNYKNNEYSAKIDYKTQKEKYYGFDAVKETNITLVSNQLGNKNIYNKVENETLIFLKAQLAGAIVSPLSDCIAVIHSVEQKGWEGPPNLIHIKIAGANLISGFTK